jgi:hypothetical protein
MGKSKSKNDESKSFDNPVSEESSSDSPAGGGGGGSSSSALLGLICGGVALVTALIALATAPSTDEFVSKADHDALKATVARLQSQSDATQATVASLPTGADLAVLPTNADLAAAVATAASSSDLTALQNDLAGLQTQVAGLPSEEELTATQTQVAQLMGAHFLCANGYGGVDCTLDRTPPAIECPAGTISVNLAADGAVTAADIPRPSALYDTGPGAVGELAVRLSSAEADVLMLSTATVPDGVAQWASAAQPFPFSDGNVDANTFAETATAGDTTRFFYSATDTAGNMASCSVLVHFVDADECSDGVHSCHADALCTNLSHGESGGDQATGSYNCECRDGFEGDGWSCESTETTAQNWKIVFSDDGCDGTYARVGEIGLYDTHTFAYPTREEAYANGLLPLAQTTGDGEEDKW